VALDVRELLRLVYKHNFEQAFHIALSRCDLSIVSWLCSHVNLSHQQCAQTQQYVKIYFYFLGESTLYPLMYPPIDNLMPNV